MRSAAPDAPPVPPLNLVGDFGGGGMLLAFGIACAVIEARALRAAARSSMRRWSTAPRCCRRCSSACCAAGRWSEARGGNVARLRGAPWYDTYATRDGKYVAIGAIEPKFYAELLKRPRPGRCRAA